MSDPVGGTRADWQSDKCLVEACRHMLLNNVAADVTFSVGAQNPDKIQAHKFVLICRSSVFQAMFSSEFSNKNEAIVIPDVEPGVFKDFLMYIYTDDTSVNGENVLALLYTAKKYAVQPLVRLCLTFLSNGRSPSNICAILEQAHIYDEDEFLKKSVDYILENARDVLKSDGFVDLCADCVKKIIECDELQADERTVLEAVTRWARSQCDKQEQEKTPENQRRVLGDILYMIRFPLLGESHYTNVVSDSDLLSSEEKVELFKYFYKKGAETKLFITRDRYAPCQLTPPMAAQAQLKPDDRWIQTCMRFNSVFDDGSWYCGGEPDAIAFSANQIVNLHGALVYGSYIGEGSYDIVCTVYDDNERELLQTRTQIKTSEQQLTYMILFEEALVVSKDKKYTIVIKVTNPDGVDTYQGRNGATSVTVGSVKFSFSRSKFSRNGTDVKMGQIPGLLFSTK